MAIVREVVSEELHSHGHQNLDDIKWDTLRPKVISGLKNKPVHSTSRPDRYRARETYTQQEKNVVIAKSTLRSQTIVARKDKCHLTGIIPNIAHKKKGSQRSFQAIRGSQNSYSGDVSASVTATFTQFRKYFI
eukprot:IDg10158t1